MYSHKYNHHTDPWTSLLCNSDKNNPIHSIHVVPVPIYFKQGVCVCVRFLTINRCLLFLVGVSAGTGSGLMPAKRYSSQNQPIYYRTLKLLLQKFLEFFLKITQCRDFYGFNQLLIWCLSFNNKRHSAMIFNGFNPLLIWCVSFNNKRHSAVIF